MRIRWTIVTALLLAVAQQAAAQLTVAVQMDPNPSPYIADWRANPNTVRLIVSNPGRETQLVRVDASIQGDARGRVAETSLTAAVPPVAIPPGTSILSAADARVLDEGVVRYIGPSQAEAMRSGRLPDDRFQLCIQLAAYDAPHAALSPRMCASFRIALVQPPDLIYPPDNGRVTAVPSFQWSVVPVGTGRFARYEISLIELSPGQDNPASAIRSNPTLLVRESSLPAYQYLPSDPVLQQGRRYAWRVRAVDPERRMTFVNDGWSMMRTFTYGPDTAAIVMPQALLPDTLLAGSFAIVVESWDAASASVDKKLRSGIGRVRFSCGSAQHRRIGGFDKDKGSIRVAFRDVHWIGPVASSVVLDQGFAAYPTAPAHPPVPALVPLDSGFTLAIDSLVITPSDATVRGAILLPASIIADGGCTRARVGLPPTVITSHCAFYQAAPDSAWGPWYVGATDIIVRGTGYVIDCSATQSPPGSNPPLPLAWNGIALNAGTTPAVTDSIVSNRGYTKARYTLASALVTAGGFEARLACAAPFAFRTLDPYGYDVELAGNAATDFLQLRNSAVTGGRFENGSIALPAAAVRAPGNASVRVTYDSLLVQPDMDLFAVVALPGGSTLAWGEFVRTPGQPAFHQISVANDLAGQFYLAARSMRQYAPVHDTVFKTPTVDVSGFSPYPELEERQGVTFLGGPASIFTVWTRDIPDPSLGVTLPEKIPKLFWMNIAAQGVHAEFIMRHESEYLLDVGPTWKKDGSYRGGTAFHLLFTGTQKKHGDLAKTRFVSSAVWDCNWKGAIVFDVPMKETIPFARLMFTSTADCAGGSLMLATPANLDHWGVQLTAKDTAASAGVVCVKHGVVYLTAAGFHEPVHFAHPFNLVWGEIKANGNLGRMYFDYDNAGQQFDHFPYSPSFVALSDYVAGDSSAWLQTCGMVSVSFFGAKQMRIADYKSLTMKAPYLGRSVQLSDPMKCGCPESDLHWTGNWSGKLGNMDFTVGYDDAAQEGFVGHGSTDLAGIEGSMTSTMVVRAGRSCICITDPGSHAFSFGYLSSFAMVAKVWGCGCIVGEALESFVVGGELEAGGTSNSCLSARGGAIVAVKLAIRPAWRRFTMSGDMFISLSAGAGDVQVTGAVDLLKDGNTGTASGSFKGSVAFESIVSGLTGSGEFEWWFGDEATMMQGRVAVALFGSNSGGAECGIFIGIAAPKSKAWVMDDIDGHFGVNKNLLPDKLTGFYGYLSFSSSLSISVISGGYKAFAGLGALADFKSPESSIGSLGLLGNVGVHVWGEILAGFASAEAWGNLQMAAGIPPGFHGTLGLEACVLWSICKGISLDCGYNSVDGFYLD